MNNSPHRRWRSVWEYLHSVLRKPADSIWHTRRRSRRLAAIEALETRVLPTVTFSVVFEDPGGANAGYYNDLEQNCLAAAACWGQYLSGNAPIEIKIYFSNIPTAAAGSATAFFLRNEDGIDVYAQGAAGEILTGIDNNGATPDININFGTSFLANYLWFDPTPFDDVEPVPNDKTDTFSIFIHEIGHALGFNGSINGTDGSLPSTYETTWDRWISFDGTNLFFNGPNAIQAYGGPVPVTYGNATHIGNAAPRPGSELDHDVMSGFTAYNGERRRPSALDLAILADAEVPLIGNAAPVGILLTNKVTSLPESTSTTSRVKVADIDILDDETGTNVLNLTGTDAASFEIFNGDLYLKANTALNFETKPSYQLNITVNDTTVGITPDITKSFSLSITDVNEAPTAVNFTNVTSSILETTNTSSHIKVADVTITDDALGTNVLSLSGTDSAAFELISGTLYLRAGTTLNRQTKPTYLVTVNVNDSTVGSNPDASSNFTLTISTLNVPPTAVTLTNPVNTLPENTSTITRLKVADINVSDDGLGTNTLSVSGPDMAAFEIVGSALYIKAGTILNFEAKSVYQVTVRVDDTTVGATPDATTGFTLTLTDLNDPPASVTLTNTVTTLPENTPTTNRIKLADITVTDGDAVGTNDLSIGGTDSAAFEIINNVLYLKAGVALDFETKSAYQIAVNVDDTTVGATPDLSQSYILTLTNLNEAPTGVNFANAVTSLGDSASTIARTKLANVVAVDDALGTNAFSLSGPDMASFELISGVLYLKAGVVLNVQTKPSYQVSVSVDDVTVGTTPDASSTFTLTINDVNQAPTGINLSSTSVAENEPAGTIVGALSSIDPDTGDTSSFALIPGFGSTDNASFNIVDGKLVTAASFNFEAKATFAIRVQVSDRDGATFDKQFTITVTNVNEAPTNITLQPPSVAENEPIGTFVGSLISTDPDASNSFTYSFAAGGTDNSAFTILNGQLFTAVSFDFETQSNYVIRVLSTDQGGKTFTKDLAIAIDDANDFPTDISLTVATIAEGQSVGSIVGTFSSIDQDAGSTFTYQLVSGSGSTDNSSFTISNGQLRTGATFDFETKNSYSIRVSSTDSGGRLVEKQFTISVTNVNEAPTRLDLNGNTIAENEPAGSVVGTFTGFDQDAGSVLTYTLVPGQGSTNNSSFTISDNRLLTGASFDFETKNSYSIRVRAADQFGLFFDREFTISITNRNEAPTGINLPVTSISENQPIGTVVSTFSSLDPDAGNTFGYSLVDGLGATDNGSFTITSGQLLSAASFNFETKSSYAIRVRTTDQGGLTFDKNFTITVNDVNEAPSITAGQVFNIAENSSQNASVGTVFANDPDSGAPFNLRTFSITAGNTNEAFSIDPATGQITVSNAAPLDFETNQTFVLTIALADGGGASAVPTTVTVQLTNLNEAPTISALGSESIPEDGVSGTLTFTIGDPETAAGNLTVQATSSNQSLVPNANLILSGTGGSRGLVISPLADQTGTATITVTVSDGVTSTTRTIPLTVVPINDAPTLSSFPSPAIFENHSTGPIAFTVGDVDNALSSLTITITSSNPAVIPNSSIVIDGTGANRALTATPLPNRSGATVITVTVSDGALTAIEEFDVTVTAVDDPPVLSVDSSPLAYRIASKQIVAIAPAAAITDPDTPVLNFTRAVLKISGQSAKDQLLILKQGGVSLKGKSVLFNGTVVGTLAGGKKGAALTITLNDFATQAAAQGVLRVVGFKCLDKTAGERTLKIEVTNIGGITPAPATRKVLIGT